MDNQKIIKALESIIEDLKQQQDAVFYYRALKVGDVLPDNSIVVYKEDAELLIAAPKETEVKCVWSEDFAPVFNKLKEQGFNPDEWFVPNMGQLMLAYLFYKKAFASPYYWSSTDASSANSCNVLFNNGYQNTGSKANTSCVRAFRRVFL